MTTKPDYEIHDAVVTLSASTKMKTTTTMTTMMTVMMEIIDNNDKNDVDEDDNDDADDNNTITRFMLEY